MLSKLNFVKIDKVICPDTTFTVIELKKCVNECPDIYVNYKSTCYIECPPKTYKDNQS